MTVCACRHPTALRRLERPSAKQKVDDVAFVRLKPIELDRRHGPEVQSIDVHRIHETTSKLWVGGDGAADERWTDCVNHPIARALDYGREREHVLLARDRCFRRSAVD